jgi:hypothetical protein
MSEFLYIVYLQLNHGQAHIGETVPLRFTAILFSKILFKKRPMMK